MLIKCITERWTALIAMMLRAIILTGHRGECVSVSQSCDTLFSAAAAESYCNAHFSGSTEELEACQVLKYVSFFGSSGDNLGRCPLQCSCLPGMRKGKCVSATQLLWAGLWWHRQSCNVLLPEHHFWHRGDEAWVQQKASRMGKSWNITLSSQNSGYIGHLCKQPTATHIYVHCKTPYCDNYGNYSFS